jgi:hypothetical protein
VAFFAFLHFFENNVTTALLAHLNLELRSNLVVAKELACDVKARDKAFEGDRFVSITVSV